MGSTVALAVEQSANAATAAMSNATAKAPAAIPTSPFNLILGIVFLMLLVAGAWWLIRRAGGMQWPVQRSAMKVVATLPVGQRERVVLIEVGGEQMLLGVAPGRVNLLHRFDEPVITNATGGEEFASRMRQLLQNSLGRP